MIEPGGSTKELGGRCDERTLLHAVLEEMSVPFSGI